MKLWGASCGISWRSEKLRLGACESIQNFGFKSLQYIPLGLLGPVTRGTAMKGAVLAMVSDCWGVGTCEGQVLGVDVH